MPVTEGPPRPLNAIIVKSVIQQKNRTLGKYENSCFMFEVVDDVEFAMQRELFSTSCDSAGASISSWKIGKNFRSQWNAED
jgi:hypothetical protein